MINLTNIFVKYGDRVLLDNVSFVIKDKDRIGLVGRNGAGKSTMLKILSGYQTPDGGNVVRPSGSTLGFLHQEMELPKGKTVMEETMTAFKEVLEIEKRLEEINVELETRTDYESDAYSDLIVELSEKTERHQMLGGSTMQADIERILAGLGFKTTDLSRLTDEFSGGWQMRIELAKMLLQSPDYLLLDEPTNHLDIESILWLEKFLETYEGAVIVISHDKMFLDNVTKRTIEIELGKAYDYKAAYTKYLTLRAERREKLESSFKNQQRVIAQKERVINKFMAKANKTKMAQSMKKQLDKMERVEMDDVSLGTMRLRFPPAPRSGEIVVKGENIVKSYGTLSVLNEVNLQIERGDKVAFVGQNGQGKTTLSKIIAGVEASTKGDVSLGHNVSLGYYAQNQAESLHGDSTVLEAIEAVSPEDKRTSLRGILGSFMFSGEDVDKKVKVLSGGERARLAMACLLLRPVNLLILDEPTNHLDIASKTVLKEAIKNFDGTMIVVSHDRDFLEGMTTRTIEFRDQKLYDHVGDLMAFLEKRKMDNMREVELRAPKNKTKNVEKQLSFEEQKAKDKEIKKKQRRVKNAERLIEELEAKIKKIEVEMGAENFYTSPNSEEVLAKYTTLKKELEAAYEEWEVAQEAMEA